MSCYRQNSGSGYAPLSTCLCLSSSIQSASIFLCRCSSAASAISICLSSSLKSHYSLGATPVSDSASSTRARLRAGKGGLNPSSGRGRLPSAPAGRLSTTVQFSARALKWSFSQPASPRRTTCAKGSSSSLRAFFRFPSLCFFFGRRARPRSTALRSSSNWSATLRSSIS